MQTPDNSQQIIMPEPRSFVLKVSLPSAFDRDLLAMYAVEISYIRELSVKDGDAKRSLVSKRGLVSEAIDSGIAVDNVASDTFRVSFLSPAGISLFEGDCRLEQVGNDGIFSLQLSQSGYDRMVMDLSTSATVATQTLDVRALLLPANAGDTSFSAYSVFVALVPESIPADAPLRAHMKPFSEISGVSALSVLTWKPAKIAVDGSFAFSFSTDLIIKGWMWWLKGGMQLVGFCSAELGPDTSSVGKLNGGTVVIPIPSLPEPEDAKTPHGDRMRRRASTPVNQAEIANNPDTYAEDPGTSCQPFSKADRIIGQKKFSVILRVEMPEIGFGKDPIIKDPIGFPPKLDDLNWPPSYPFDPRPPGGDPPRDGVGGLGLMLGTSPKFGSVRKRLSPESAIDWEGKSLDTQASSVALGNILDISVDTHSNGYSLGSVVNTLTLAPRQARRIQKVERYRQESARRSERQKLQDSVQDSLSRERDYEDRIAANLSEWARGSSSSRSGSSAGGVGFFYAGFVVGGGAVSGSSYSSSSQEAARATSAHETQRLRDAIQRYGEAIRKLDSVVIAEVDESEGITGTTEIIRNANYTRSITVIYHEILRHLKVVTKFVQARQCLYVPFKMSDFDAARAYRWRESIQRNILSTQFAKALKYLRAYRTNFHEMEDEIPAGERSKQPVKSIRGSIYVDLAVARPKDTTDNAYDEMAWKVLYRFLPFAPLQIYTRLGSILKERDRIFQAEFAPAIARKWLNTLKMKFGANLDVDADFTLAGNYAYGSNVRVDFRISPSALAKVNTAARKVTAEEFEKGVEITASQDLPPGSVANVTGISLTYDAATYSKTKSEGRLPTPDSNGTGLVDDLIEPDTGKAASEKASFVLPLEVSEKLDEREEIKAAVHELLEHLNEHVEYYHKAILWEMDRDRLLMLLEGVKLYDTNVSIASVVEREPVGIIGNSLIYPISPGSFIPQDRGRITTKSELDALYLGADECPGSAVNTDTILVALPTDGVYARTIMDDCNALEEHYGGLDWVLNDIEPELGSIDPTLMTSRQSSLAQTIIPSTLPTTTINLQNAPEAPQPNGVADIFNVISNPNSFRDMAGLEGTQANTAAAMQAAASLATNFGTQAANIELAKITKAKEATQAANQKVASIQNARNKNLITQEEAAAQTREALAAMNPDSPKSESPHENAVINAAIKSASERTGSLVEANTGEGSVKIRFGPETSEGGGNTGRGFFAFWRPDSTPVLEREVRQTLINSVNWERSVWFNDGPYSEENDLQMFGHLVKYWLGTSPTIPSETLVKLQRLSTDGTIIFGANPASKIDEIVAQLVSAIPENGQQLKAAIRQSVIQAVKSNANSTPWSAAFICSVVRATAIQLRLEQGSESAHGDASLLLNLSESHWKYLVDCYRRKIFGRPGFQAFDINRPIQIGDIIVQDRHAKIDTHVWRYNDILKLEHPDYNGRDMHADIVTEVDYNSGYAVAIGGNVGQSVRRRRFPISDRGTLIVAVDKRYFQDSDTGALSDIPDANPTVLETLSTRRIFSVLSLVPEHVQISSASIA